MVVQGSTLHSDSWMFLYKMISGNVTNPKNGSQIKVLGAFPGTLNDTTYPLITIEPITNDSDTPTFGTSKSNYENTTQIDIFTDSAAHMDTISDNLITTFHENKSLIVQSGLSNFNTIDNGIDHTPIDGDKTIHIKSIGLSFGFDR